MNPPVSPRFLLIPTSLSDSVFPSKIVVDLSFLESQIPQFGGGLWPSLWMAYGLWFLCPICRVSQEDCIEMFLNRRFDDINFFL